MRFSTVTVVLWMTACGGGSPSGVCPSEKHLADPDGRGERCIADDSTCERASDCTTDDTCCTPACADGTGAGVYACTESCRRPACTDGSCAADQRCQAGLDECSAYCVPVTLECPDGTVAADPTGSGQFVCIAADSECYVPTDCPADPQGCCSTSCADSGDGQYVCDLVCADGSDNARPAPDGDGEADVIAECTSDSDCDTINDGVGWRCVADSCYGTNTCVPPEPCTTADDCTLATNLDQCCSCPVVVPRSTLGYECWVEYPQSGSEPGIPEEDFEAPTLCGDTCSDECPTIGCAIPASVECQAGTCVGVY